MANPYSIEPKSRKYLRGLALGIRKAVGLENCIYFPIVEFMEHMMPRMFNNFNYEIIEDDKLPRNKHAVTEIAENYGTVKIKQSVYEGACDGNGQHRMTIAHEIVGHFIPICVLGFKLYRSFEINLLPAYRDPEWQAKCLAGELMMAEHLVRDFKPTQLEIECGVSKDAAKYQRKIFMREVK